MVYEISNRIEEVRLKIPGLTQKILAELAGQSWRQLCRWIENENCPSLINAAAVAGVLKEPVFFDENKGVGLWKLSRVKAGLKPKPATELKKRKRRRAQ